jgi:serine-type D-Ala-D-Ala endopeptidase (penicillin-binding protein 7)
VLPIASITKIMTAMVLLDARQSMTEPLEISSADVDLEKNSRSRLRTGSTLARGEMLQLALMASENRAASALARYYPGGTEAFVIAMNRKAKTMQMEDTQFFDATGLSHRNMSNARDLALMVKKAGDYPLIRQYSTAGELTVDTGLRMISFRNTNRLIENPEWQISLSKTGYISEAGNCLVMHTRINDQPVVMVLLDAVGRFTRFADASRLRTYLELGPKVIKAQSKAKTHG